MHVIHFTEIQLICMRAGDLGSMPDLVKPNAIKLVNITLEFLC